MKRARILLQIWLFALCSTMTVRVHAAVIDINAFYFTDSTSGAKETTDAQTHYALFLGFNLDKKGNLLAGWNYASYSTTSKDDATETEFASTQMGPGFVWFIDRDHSWRLFAAYNLKTDTTYNRTGATEEDWRGTGIAGDLGYQLHFSESFDIAVRLNYASTTVTEKVVGSVKTDVSYKKDLIYPSIGFSFFY